MSSAARQHNWARLEGVEELKTDSCLGWLRVQGSKANPSALFCTHHRLLKKLWSNIKLSTVPLPASQQPKHKFHNVRKKVGTRFFQKSAF